MFLCLIGLFYTYRHKRTDIQFVQCCQLSTDISVGTIHRDNCIVQVLQYGEEFYKLLSSDRNDTELTYNFEGGIALHIYFGRFNMSYSLQYGKIIIKSGTLDLLSQCDNLDHPFNLIQEVYRERT
jgi:hypothetical protein